MTDEYAEAEIQRLLTEDAGIAEQGLIIRAKTTTDQQIVMLTGEVATAQRRDEILRLVRDHFPDAQLQVDIGLTHTEPPSHAEELT